MIGSIVGYGIVIIIGLVVLLFVIGLFAGVVDKITRLKREGKLPILVIVELISTIIFVVSLIQWNKTPYGFWGGSILLSSVLMIGFFFFYGSEFKRDENEPGSNEVDSLFDNLNTRRNQLSSASTLKSSNNSTQTNQSYVRKQQMVSSSWKIQSEPVGSWSEYGKDKRNYAEENVEFIADFLKKNMTSQLRDINPTVSISETQTLKEIYFNTYLPDKDKYDRMEIEKTAKGKELIQNFVKIEKNVTVCLLHLNNQILSSVDENYSIRAIAELIEPHLSFSSFLENDKGKELFEIIDEMFNLINDEHFATINSSKQYIQINQNNSNTSSVKKVLDYTLAVDLNHVGRFFASNPEMERLWTGIRQYIFASHYHSWINYGEFYDISLYNWKNLFETCIKNDINAELCEYIYNEKKYASSFEDGQDPINLFVIRISGLLILAGIAAGKHSKLVSDLASLRSRLIKKIAEFDGKVTSDEEEQVDDLISNMDEVFDLDLSGKKAKAEEEMKQALESLNSMIGLDSVKHEVLSLKNIVEMQKRQSEQGLSVVPMSYHCVFTGNPGTGKTTVARIIAQIYKGLGILKKGHLVECDRSSLVAGYVGQTAIKTNEVIDKALDGVLFIDEAYSLAKDGDSFGQEAIDTLLKRMEDDRNRLVVIVAGYTNEMKTFIDSNPGLKSRFNRYIEFEDYSAEEMLTIFKNLVTKQNYTLSEESEKVLLGIFKDVKESEDNSFGNARGVRNLFEKILVNQANRVAKNGCVGPKTQILLPEDFEDGRPKRIKKVDAMAQLTSMIGLQSVKQEILTLRNIVAAQKKRAAAGLPVLPMSYHCVFTGNPGTGKTSVARIVAEIYKDLGVLRKGHLVECDRSSLVAGYVGQTAIKTNEIIDKALDGVLFIDEAYTLVKDGDSFGQEAVDTLLKRMEDDRKRLVVIVAGYTNEMKNFIESNPGLKSRFNRYIEFEDYTEDELVELFKKLAEEQKFVLSEGFEEQLRLTLRSILSENTATFGNGRGVRNLFEKAVLKQANRLAMVDNDNADMQLLMPEDLPEKV